MARDQQIIDYLQDARGVLSAGRGLRQALATPQRTTAAVLQLERAAERYGGSSDGARTFMFTELDAAPAQGAARERASEDVLATVLSDLNVANVLFAGGQAVGEDKPRTDPNPNPNRNFLDQSLERLDRTAAALERGLAGGDAAARGGRFGFGEFAFDETDPGERPASPPAAVDLPSAISAYRTQSARTQNALTTAAAGAVTAVAKAFSNVDGAKLLEAVAKLGGQVDQLPTVGRLLRLGARKLSGALDALNRLLGGEALAWVRDRVKQVWQDVTEGKHVTRALEVIFGVDEAKAHVEGVLALDGLRAESLDAAGPDLSALEVRFAENMKLAEGVVAALGLGATICSFTPLAGPAWGVAASAYAVTLGAVVLLGMDYADAGGPLKRVRGIRQIADGLRPPPPSPAAA